MNANAAVARRLTAALVCSSLASGVAAQSWPAKPITLIVPYPPGGGTDIVARIYQEPLGRALGQPIVIENRGGAGGSVGTALAAKAAPDGHTFLLTLSSHTINPTVMKVPYDIEKDFVGVSLVASLPQIITAHPSAPYDDLKGMLAWARANPGKLNYASVGNGSPSHIAGELLKLKTGIEMVHVPYKGGGPAVTANLAGEVPVMFVSIPPAMAHVKAGKLKALAVTTAARSPAAPDIPTVSEALALPGYEVDSWYAVFAVVGTPAPIVQRLHAAIARLAGDAQIREKLLLQGASAVSSTPEALEKIVRDELRLWTEVVKAAGIGVQ